MTRTIPKLLLEVFGGNPYHAVGKTRSDGTGIWYEPVLEPLDVERLEQHLAGEIVLGSYPVDSGDNTVRWCGWDVDAAGDLKEARTLTSAIVKELEHLPFLVEFSGGKGYHVLLLLQEPVPAATAKAFTEHIRDKLGLPKSVQKGKAHVECYPKQVKVGIGGGNQRQAFGNLLKVPLGQHLLSREWSCLVDHKNGWEQGALIPPEEALTWRTDPAALTTTGEGVDQFEQLAFAIAAEWQLGMRHHIALFLSGYLVNSGWEHQETHRLVERICVIRNDNETENRLGVVDDTYEKHSREERVAGYQRLGEVLTAPTLAKVVKLAHELATPDLAQQLSKIRHGKGPAWAKEERVANLIWAYLSDVEIGRMLTTGEDTYYWFSEQLKQTFDLSDPMWDATLYRLFRLNTSDSFGSHVKTILLHKARLHSQLLPVHLGTHWDGQKLFVNLGDVRIWVLDGKNIVERSNGQDGVFFRTRPDVIAPQPDWDNTVDAWQSLVNDLNFASSGNVPIPDEQQKELLKAWILATFFREVMPTRPILTILGDPGSGKTTAARRIVQVLEGIGEDVLSVESDKPDFLRVAVAGHRVFVLDNLERTRATWLVDALNRIATGTAIELRKLYTNNQMYRIVPNCFVILTAVNMPFTEETLFERMLTINLEKLKTFTPQHTYNQRIRSQLNGIWADLLHKLNAVVSTMQQPVHMTANLRLADFALFCKQLGLLDVSGYPGVIDAQALRKGLFVLGNSQALALMQSDHSIYPVLQQWVDADPAGAAQWRTVTDLYPILAEAASRSRRDFRWKDSRGLQRHMAAIKNILVLELGAVIRTIKDSKFRDVNEWAFRPDAEEQ